MPILRSKFVASEQGVRAVPIAKPPLKEFDLTAYDEGKTRIIVEGLKKNLLSLPIDITSCPPSREALVRLADDSFLFILVCHHIAFDVVSALIFASEISHIYNAEMVGDPIELDPDPPQYAVYAEEERAGTNLADSIAFWRQTLAQPLPRLSLPTSCARPEKSKLIAGWTTGEFDEATASNICQIARSANTTVYSVLMTFFGLALCLMGKQDEILVGFPSSSRVKKDHEGIVGPMFNPVVVRIERRRGDTLASIIARVSDRIRLAISHQGHAFEAVSHEIRAIQDNASSPFYQAMLLHYADQSFCVPLIDLQCSLEPVDVRPSGLDFCLYMVEEQGGMKWRMQFDKEIYSEMEAQFIVTAMQKYALLKINENYE